MNNNSHLLAIVESKLSQARTHMEHNSVEAAQSLLAQVAIYSEELRQDIRAP